VGSHPVRAANRATAKTPSALSSTASASRQVRARVRADEARVRAIA
jgi:hypothetical protein